MPHLALSVLGPFQVALDGQAVAGFEYDKVRALLVYLAVEAARPHRRDALTALLWPDQPDAAARTNLRQALATLRHAIDDAIAQPPFLLVARETVQFNAASDHQLDLTAFTRMLADCTRHAHRRRATCRSCEARLAKAAALYQGDFLAGFGLRDSVAFDEWAAIHRERLHEQALQAFAHLGVYYETRGEYDAARHTIARLVELEPWREEAQRQLMRVLALAGERGAALAQYERCRRVLQDELGVEPEPETTALYERIRAGMGAPARVNDGATYPDAQVRPSLPALPTRFVGREAELAELAGLLEDPACRLISVVGPGGVGKTRVALQAAGEQLGVFADGVHIALLAPVATAEFLVPALAAAVGLSFQAGADPEAQLVDYLSTKELLLVLDNVEHLLGATAGLLASIVRRAPAVTLLVTSRERLQLEGEWVVELAGLAFPTPAHSAQLEGFSAVQLFLECARRVHGGFALTFADTPGVARICRLVEGLPLAIELAATWTRVLACAEIAVEIEHSLGFLRTTGRAVSDRHRSLHAVFDQSWRLLAEDERRVLRALSIFRGGFRRDAAEEVAGATLPHLAALVDKSLLRRSGAERYDLHELFRQYAAERLWEAGEEAQAQERRLGFFVRLAERAEPELRGPRQEAWFKRFEEEHDNLRAALQWAIEHDEVEAAARLGGALWLFWWAHGHLSEGERWLERVLSSRAALPAALRAKALNGAGVLTRCQGDYAAARARFEESLALWRELDDTQGVAIVLNNLGLVAYSQGDYATSGALQRESLALRRELGDRAGMARALSNLSNTAYAQGDYATAHGLYREGLALMRELGDKAGIATMLNNLGVVAEAQGDDVEARALHQESLALRRELGDKAGIASSLGNLADVDHAQGNYAAAGALYRESLALRRELGDKAGIAEALEGVAAADGALGHAGRALGLVTAAGALRAAVGAPLPPVERARLDRWLEPARQALSEAAQTQAQAQGRSMTLEQAIAFALAVERQDTERKAAE